MNSLSLPRTALVAALALALSTSLLRAGTLMFAAAKDNTLFESTTGALSNGAGDFFFTGLTGQSSTQDQRRGLLAFDLTSIDPGSTIDSITLTLYMSRTISAASDVTLHRVSQDWGESTSDAPAQEGTGASAAVGDATWLHAEFFTGADWLTPGGDFDSTASATQSVGEEGFYSWSAPGMIADAQAWVNDPSLNFGWLLLGDESVAGATTKQFASREHFTAARRPVLTIDFTPVPEPSRALLLLAGGLMTALRRRRP